MGIYLKTGILVLIVLVLSWSGAGCSMQPVPESSTPVSSAPLSPVADETPVNTVQASPEVLSVIQSPEAVAVDPTPDVADSEPANEEITRLLKDLGPAPEFEALTWINADPMTLADLRGRVVLVEFWSYG